MRESCHPITCSASTPSPTHFVADELQTSSRHSKRGTSGRRESFPPAEGKRPGHAVATTVSGRPTCSSAPDLVPNLVPRTQTQLVLRHSAEDSLRSAFAGGAEALVPFLGFIAVVLSHYKLIATTQPTPSPEDVCPPPRGTPAILSPTCAPSVSGRPRARKCGDVADVACFGRLHPILPTPLHSHPALRRRGLLLAKTRADYVPSLFRSPPSTASPFSTVSNSGTTPAEVRASSTSLVGRWWCEKIGRASCRERVS